MSIAATRIFPDRTAFIFEGQRVSHRIICAEYGGWRPGLRARRKGGRSRRDPVAELRSRWSI